MSVNPHEGWRDLLFLDGVHVAMNVSTMCLPGHRIFLSTCLVRRNIHVGTLSLFYLDVSKRAQTYLPLNIQLTPRRHPTNSAPWPSTRFSTASASAMRATCSRRC